jgi:hypothetical protein
MTTATITLFVSLLAVVVLLSALATYLTIPSPIVLVVGGVLLSFLPGLPLSGVLLITIERDHQMLIPQGETVLDAGDVMTILAPATAMATIQRQIVGV